jgi:hypothetical protein
VWLHAAKGQKATIKLRRINIAERLYRITGGGVYRDSVLLGLPVPTKNPVINGLVMGQDSAHNTVYKGKLFWIWGDTLRPSYLLGQFWASGATSLLPGKGGLDPEAGVDLTYFVDKTGFSRPMARMTDKNYATWISALITLPGKSGEERLFAYYGNFKGFTCMESGLAAYNDEKEAFEKVTRFDPKSPFLPHGPVLKVLYDGIEYLYFRNPVRIRARAEYLPDLSHFEAFTCLKEGSGKENPVFDRDKKGRIRYGWKKNTPPPHAVRAGDAALKGKVPLEKGEFLYHLQDPDTGKPVPLHAHSIRWNEFRKRYVMILSEQFGTSFLGEVWYAEADCPIGPWVYARKIVTHDNYSFYNVVHHPMFDKEGGRILFFEGTYTYTFSTNKDPTPRYDYNQILYKLDLADPRLVLPVPIYDLSADLPGRFGTASALRKAEKEYPLAFFATDRPGKDTVPIFAVEEKDGSIARLCAGKPARGKGGLMFYALPPDSPRPPVSTRPLFEFVNEQTGRRAYSVDKSWTRAGFRRSERPLCLVWRNPMSFQLPVVPYRPVK